jgi:hypothetical protein
LAIAAATAAPSDSHLATQKTNNLVSMKSAMNRIIKAVVLFAVSMLKPISPRRLSNCQS